ncbi:MAG: molybdenum cofactor guanylyltransferase [Rhodospirillaceae bacterium]|nr:molybdenum cofactor guanylyltransferase [Rhodospirillaceae bacterium]
MTGPSRFSTQAHLPIAAVLAGGAGERMKNARLNKGPKPLVLLNGLALIGHVINAVTPQVRGMVLVLRSPEPWADQFKLRVVTDDIPDAGPAAGVATVLSALQSETDLVLTAPADCPFLPDDLSARLQDALTPGADIAVAASGGQRHHLAALWRTRIAPDVTRAVALGLHAVHDLQSRFKVAEAVWSAAPHDPFFNINTPDDLTRAEAICSHRRGGNKAK